MINTITEKMKVELPKQKPFCLTVSKGDKQNKSNVANFAVQVPLPKKKTHVTSVPILLNFSGCKTKAQEKLRERCMKRLCVHLSEQERTKVEAKIKEEQEDALANPQEEGTEVNQEDAVVEQEDDFSEDRG